MSVALDPLQIVSSKTLTVGTGFTVTVPVTAAFWQPVGAVYTSVYELVVFGLTVMLGEVDPLDQE